jgi:sec-independent protein translocase protein TatA
MQGMEWIILLVVAALLLFGVKKIPDLAKSFGRAKGEFEKGKREVEREIREMENESSNPPEAKAESSIVKAAEDLGIETTGKSKEDLKKEIQVTVQSS